MALPLLANIGAETLRRRLRAWWTGFDSSPISDDVDAPPIQTDAPIERDADSETPWPAARRELVQMIWGEGMVTPGGEDYVIDLVKPAAVNQTRSMLQLGAGMGGATRALVRAFGVYVTGMDASRELARAGMADSRAHELEVKAPVSCVDFETVRLKAAGFHCVLAHEVLSRIVNRERLIKEMVTSLKPEGTLICADFVLGAAGPSLSAEDWAVQGEAAGPPWSHDRILEVLAGHGLTVHVAVDETDRYRLMTLSGLDRFTREIKRTALQPAHISHLLREAERWVARLRLLQTGVLGYCRIEATKPKKQR